MTELLVAFGMGVLGLLLLVGGLAIWRIGRVVSWRALAMTARATGSFTACVAFIRLCDQGSGVRTPREFEPHRGIRALPGRPQTVEADR